MIYYELGRAGLRGAEGLRALPAAQAERRPGHPRGRGAELIPPPEPGTRCRPYLDDALDVAVPLGEVHGAQLGRALPVLHVGPEHGARAFPLPADDATHGALRGHGDSSATPATCSATPCPCPVPALPLPAAARARVAEDGHGWGSGSRRARSYLAPASRGKKEALTSRARRGPSGGVTSRREGAELGGSLIMSAIEPGTAGGPRDGGQGQRGC